MKPFPIILSPAPLVNPDSTNCNPPNIAMIKLRSPRPEVIFTALDFEKMKENANNNTVHISRKIPIHTCKIRGAPINLT